jgi:mannose-6-phosphate isomerase-like protein (cupin superfamily)
MTCPYWLFELHLRVLAEGQHNETGYDLIEGRFPPGTQTHLHLHTRYDELIYVLEGALTVYTYTGAVTLMPGQHAFIPRSTPHVVAAAGPSVNRSLTIATPGGVGQLIRTVGVPDHNEGVAQGQHNDLGLFLLLSLQTGDIILGSPGARPT